MTATLIYSFANLIPASTRVANPVTLSMSMPTGNVEWIEAKIPDGCNGGVGWYLASHGNQVIPFSNTGPNYIVGNNDDLHWDLDGLMDSGDWQLIGYNLGAYPHTIYVRFGWSPIEVTAAGNPILPNSALSSP